MDIITERIKELVTSSKNALSNKRFEASVSHAMWLLMLIREGLRYNKIITELLQQYKKYPLLILDSETDWNVLFNVLADFSKMGFERYQIPLYLEDVKDEYKELINVFETSKTRDNEFHKSICKVLDSGIGKYCRELRDELIHQLDFMYSLLADIKSCYYNMGDDFFVEYCHFAKNNAKEASDHHWDIENDNSFAKFNPFLQEFLGIISKTHRNIKVQKIKDEIDNKFLELIDSGFWGSFGDSPSDEFVNSCKKQYRNMFTLYPSEQDEYTIGHYLFSHRNEDCEYIISDASIDLFFQFLQLDKFSYSLIGKIEEDNKERDKKNKLLEVFKIIKLFDNKMLFDGWTNEYLCGLFDYLFRNDNIYNVIIKESSGCAWNKKFFANILGMIRIDSEYYKIIDLSAKKINELLKSQLKGNFDSYIRNFLPNGNSSSDTEMTAELIKEMKTSIDSFLEDNPCLQTCSCT